MSFFEVKKAQRSQAKLKLGLAGSSGSGKTLGALFLGYGLLKAAHPNMSDADIWSKICVIDTENSSGALYANATIGGVKVGEYNIIDFPPPFEPQRYIAAIDAADESGAEFIIIDSLSHAWSGEGGMLDTQGKIAARTGNSYTAWRDVTPLHNQLVEKILQSRAHIVTTMRSKTEYVIEDNHKGKKVPKKIGMSPVFRDGIEYEFTVMFDVDQNHTTTSSKDRTGLFDGRFFTITPDTGKQIYGWLSTAVEEDEPVRVNKPQPASKAQETAPSVAQQVDELAVRLSSGMDKEQKSAFAGEIKGIVGIANYKKITDETKLKELLDFLKDKEANNANE